jgi:hypothetical protein
MVMEIVAAVVIVLGVLAVAGIFFVLARLRTLSSENDSSAQLIERLNSVAAGLDEKLTQTRTDIAGRLQQVKGDLSLESADRLSGGFLSLKTALENQLSSGRQEQASSLKLEIAALAAETRIRSLARSATPSRSSSIRISRTDSRSSKKCSSI